MSYNEEKGNLYFNDLSKMQGNNRSRKNSSYDGRKDDDYNADNMSESYSEISIHSNFTRPDQSADEQLSDSLNEDGYDKSSSDNDMPYGAASGQKRPASLICDKSFPFNLEGTVRKDGDLTHFVTENLEYKIKLSSPVTKLDHGQGSSSRNSTPSTSGLASRLFMQSQPQIDSNVLNDIELEAQYLAASVDNLTENLCSLLHSISSITADNVEIHKNAVNKLTDSMDANIKSMYTIMAKTEEISKSMKPTEQLAGRIREIKRLVDMLENNL